MKEDDLKNQASSFSNNPFLSKPLKKIKNSSISPNKKNEVPPKEVTKNAEHRASKYINLLTNTKNLKSSNNEKTQTKSQKKLNAGNNLCIASDFENKLKKDMAEFFSPKSKGKKNISQEKNEKDIKTEAKFEEKKKNKKRATIEIYLNPKIEIEENLKHEDELTGKNYKPNNSEPNEPKQEENIQNQKIFVTMRESLFKKSENKNEDKDKNKENEKNNDINNSINNKNIGLISFKNDDEILEYIKRKVKDGKIKNISQKLELKSNNDFTGFSLQKKDKGYTLFEIDIGEDLSKLNEIMKEKKVQVKNKQIQFVYTDYLESLIKIKEEYDSIKQATFINLKKECEKETKEKKKENENLNKINKNIEEFKTPLKAKFKLDQIDDKNKSIKTNNLPMEGISKSLRKENQTNLIKKEKNQNANIGTVVNPTLDDKKTKENQNQKKLSRAYTRFKKTFNQQKDKDNEKTSNTKNNDNNLHSSEKINALALRLKDHIIKPMGEIKEEHGEKKIYRGASVECRKSKIVEDNIVKLLENAPVSKKSVKKPKINKFVQ